MNFEDFEVPKHKKKRKKTVKKSNHKHEYEIIAGEKVLDFKLSNDDTERCYAKIIEICSVCTKEKVDFRSMTVEEYNSMMENTKNNKEC